MIGDTHSTDEMLGPDRARIAAAADLLRRTGVASLQIRWSDDQQPIVWFAVAIYPTGVWATGAGHHPREALTRLCEQVLDGGQCTHCKRMTGFDDDHDDTIIEAIAGVEICWYMWDPELATYRRGCEGGR